MRHATAPRAASPRVRRVPFVVVRRRKGPAGWIRTLPAALQAAGVEAREVVDGELELDPGSVVWIQGNPNWFPATMRALGATSPDSRPLVVCWHFEPLPHPPSANLPRARLHLREVAKIALRDERATDPYTNARRLAALARAGLPDVLAVSSRGKQEYLAERGIASEFVPLGWRAEMHGENLGGARDVDVLFLGANDVPRRERLLRRLRAQGVPVQAAGSWKHGVWGEERERLLARTKILLNLSRHPGQFSDDRLILGMANGALVVSEPIYRSDPFLPGEHYVSAPVEEMPALIARYLVDEAERERLTVSAHAFVTAPERTYEASLARVLELVDEGLAKGRP